MDGLRGKRSQCPLAPNSIAVEPETLPELFATHINAAKIAALTAIRTHNGTPRAGCGSAGCIRHSGHFAPCWPIASSFHHRRSPRRAVRCSFLARDTDILPERRSQPRIRLPPLALPLAHHSPSLSSQFAAASALIPRWGSTCGGKTPVDHHRLFRKRRSSSRWWRERFRNAVAAVVPCPPC